MSRSTIPAENIPIIGVLIQLIADLTRPTIPAEAIPIIGVLIQLIADFLGAKGDRQKEDQALMEAQEAIARERARRTLGG